MPRLVALSCATFNLVKPLPPGFKARREERSPVCWKFATHLYRVARLTPKAHARSAISAAVWAPNEKRFNSFQSSDRLCTVTLGHNLANNSMERTAFSRFGGREFRYASLLSSTSEGIFEQ